MLHGAPSLTPGDSARLGKRDKPAARTCPLCGDAVGVSAGSLGVHLRARHRDEAGAAAAAAAVAAVSSGGGGGASPDAG